MDKVIHKVGWQPQGPRDCAQVAASNLLTALGRSLSPEEIKKTVPAFINAKGEEIGTSFPHIAAFIQSQGFQTTVHGLDIELLDRSWGGLSNKELVTKLEARRKSIKHAYFGDDAIDAYVDGYKKFIEAGGSVVYPILTERYLYKLLQDKPVLAALSYNYLDSSSKKAFDQNTKKWSSDDVGGRTTTHAVVIAGYQDGKFLVIDSNKPTEKEGRRWLDAGHLIGAICLAETEWDNVVISVV